MHTGGGNEIREAAKKETVDRNVREGIEPRKFQRSERPTVFIYWKATRAVSSLITAVGTANTVVRKLKTGKILESNSLSDLFGIDLDTEPEFVSKRPKPPKKKKL